MNIEESLKLELVFDQLVDALHQSTQSTESWKISLLGERSQFIRLNQAQVRQIGTVQDGWLQLTLMQDQRSSYREFPLIGEWETDWHQVQTALESLRWEVPQLPVDPYLVLPSGAAQSQAIHPGKLLEPGAAVAELVPPIADLDWTGFYAGGWGVRAYADSAGNHHWFATEFFTLDYSLFTPEGQSIKQTLAGSEWDANRYTQQLQSDRQQLAQLLRSPKTIPRGSYRTYLAPAAVAELVGLASWGGLGEMALQQGSSAFSALRRGEKQLSPQFRLQENFCLGLVPRFNEWGEIAPLELTLIAGGQLVNSLVSQRSAKEYQQTANGASVSEMLRSPEVSPGTLSREAILSHLDRGLYVSNLHYLNWSDRPSGRITGMTRYACFWVEDGQIVAPIAHLRFDESLYHFWGEGLMAVTDFQEFIPEVGTYDHRQLGGYQVPGLLVEGFTYTL